MPEDTASADDDSSEAEGEDETRTDILRADIDPDPETAEYDLLELIAGVDGREIEELPPFYTQVGHFVERLFEHPPAQEAQMQIEFSYAGHRVRLNQQGQVTLLNVKNSISSG